MKKQNRRFYTKMGKIKGDYIGDEIEVANNFKRKKRRACSLTVKHYDKKVFKLWESVQE